MIDEIEFAIQTSRLSFSYAKDRPVVRELSMQVPKGAIYGFLGPNGAGKTTSIRLLLDLIAANSGTVKIFGKRFHDDRNGILSRTGALIETPSLYEHLTGLDNLLITAKLRKISTDRVPDAMEMVGLRTEAKKHVHSYSLGMKQRLGLAMALLSRPDLLILDEPTNGLDPNGIIEVRELLRDLNVKHNVTILISSHLLSEVERLVSHVGIIARGKMLFEGTLKDLQQVSQTNSVIEIDTSDNEAALKILKEDGYLVAQSAAFLQVPSTHQAVLARVISLLSASGLEINRSQLVEKSLEETFLSIIKDDHL